jgi:hypothetical protein
MSKCAAIAASGNPCKGMPIDGSQFCYHHHPDNAGKLSTRGQRGGKTGGRGRPRVELANIKTQLHELADSVLDGSVGRADASVAGQLLNIVLRAVTVELQVREQMELIERLEALEEALAREEEHRAS